MFGSKKSSVLEQQVGTIIGKDTHIKGTVTAQAGIRIDGTVEGDLVSAGDIIIGETGRVTALVKARSAVVAGCVLGNMEIAEKLELLATASVHGDIQVKVLTIAEGAVFKGACGMRADEGLPAQDNEKKNTGKK